MKRKTTLRICITAIFLFAVIILFHSCKKNEGPGSSGAPNTSSNLKINSLFNFETMQNVDISIQIPSSETSPMPHAIKLYDNDPRTTGQLIISGITDASLLYTAVLRIPTMLDTVWIENITPVTDLTVLREYRKVPVIGKKINYVFSMLAPYTNLKALGYSDPGCSSGCTRTIASKVSTIQVGDDEQVCLIGPFNGNVIFNTTKGTAKLVICGSDTISNITVNGNSVANIVVSNSGSLTSTNLNLLKANITNYGKFYASGGFTIGKDRNFTNYGFSQIDVLTITNGSVLNSSTINVTRELNNNGTLTNQNLLQISGSLTNSAGNSFINECRVNIIGAFQHFGNFTNKGYLLVSGNAQFNVGSKTTLAAQSNLEIASVSPTAKGQISINGDVTGPIQGSGKITIDGRTDILNSARFINQVDICDANGIESLQITLPTTVTLCKSYIPATYCTPQSGSSALKDQDGDGVPDVLDEFPTNPNRAFTSYYPNIGTFASLCFGDLWPFRGDGSMNDLVVDFQYRIITNSRNQVVDIYGTYHPKCEGAAMDNSFAVALPVPPSAVQTIEGTQKFGNAPSIFQLAPQGYESGHLNNTVFSVINSVYKYYNGNFLVNVEPTESYSTQNDINIHVLFATPIPSSQLIPPYNPFLIHNNDRSNEIHMIDHIPTELVTTKTFGTWDDNSDPSIGSYYRTLNNLPWVLEIPVSFDYTIIGTDIVLGHLKYAEWAISGGTKFKDWYMNKPGYRNNKYIYQKK